MSNMAEYVRIFETVVNDELVEKRKSAAAEMKQWLATQTNADAIRIASAVAAAFSGGFQLPEDLSIRCEGSIQRFSSSFVRSADGSDLQILVITVAAVIDFLADDDKKEVWSAANVLASSCWSALSFQNRLGQEKIEKLRVDLLVASRSRVLRIAESSRKRTVVPIIGHVTINQDSAEGAKVNGAFARAVEPLISVMRDNAALDREELDFLWWLLSDRSEILDEPLSSLPSPVRAVVSGFDAAAKLRKLPADSHRHIVLRNIANAESLNLAELLEKIGDRRVKIATRFRDVMADVPAVFPLLYSLVHGPSGGAFDNEKLSEHEWGARALLEASLHFHRSGNSDGL